MYNRQVFDIETRKEELSEALSRVTMKIQIRREQEIALRKEIQPLLL